MSRNKLLNKIEKTMDSIIEITPHPKTNKTILEGIVESYTPYLGGDFESHTNKEAISIDEHQILTYATGYPKPKSIISRMRWITSIGIATVIGLNKELDLDKITYKIAEEKPLPSIILRPEYSKISLTTLLYGSISPRGVLVEKRKNSYLKKYKAFKGIVSIKLEPLMNLFDEKIDNILQTHIENREKYRFNRYSALLKRSDKNKHKLPIRNNAIKLRISIKLNTHRLSALINNKYYDFIEKNITSLVKDTFIASILVFGIGSGVNRGFGRFKFKDPNVHSEKYSTIPSPDSIPKEFIENLLEEIVIKTGKILTGKENYNIPKTHIPLIKIPLFLKNSLDIRTINMSNIRKDDIYLDTIEEFSRYTIKSNLKNNPRDQGLNIHTWVLGLPRLQGSPPSIIARNNKHEVSKICEEICDYTCKQKLELEERKRTKYKYRCEIGCICGRCVDSYTCKGKYRSSILLDENKDFLGKNLPTGYGLLDKDRYNHSLLIIGHSCFNFNIDSNKSCVLADSNEAKPNPLRRQSMIVGFPWPTDKNNAILVLLTLFSNDLKEYVFCTNKSCLFHFSNLKKRFLGSIREPLNICSVLGIRLDHAIKHYKISEKCGDIAFTRNGGILEFNSLNNTQMDPYTKALKHIHSLILKKLTDRNRWRR